MKNEQKKTYTKKQNIIGWTATILIFGGLIFGAIWGVNKVIDKYNAWTAENRQEQAEKARKEKEEQAEKARKEKEEQAEQARKEKEEQAEQARKEKEEQAEQARKAEFKAECKQVKYHMTYKKVENVLDGEGHVISEEQIGNDIVRQIEWVNEDGDKVVGVFKGDIITNWWGVCNYE
ncbi:hypothetical protein V7157_27690 [Neobacillus drentensis]|uniref:hypothetical protein n=1 Tax=Neobacillus drentensis TaxID=220684 RepID=UPI003002B297